VVLVRGEEVGEMAKENECGANIMYICIHMEK
jgi:hypothetical protein